jgi:nitrite reductase/ring-hydroxylating ferredoxin subunit
MHLSMLHFPHERRLCRLDDVPDGGALALTDADDDLLLTRRGDAISAFHNVCPHAGQRLDWAPGKFLIRDGVLVCAAHGASFAALSGACLGGPCRGDGLRAVALRVVAGEVLRLLE